MNPAAAEKEAKAVDGERAFFANRRLSLTSFLGIMKESIEDRADLQKLTPEQIQKNLQLTLELQQMLGAMALKINNLQAQLPPAHPKGKSSPKGDSSDEEQTTVSKQRSTKNKGYIKKYQANLGLAAESAGDGISSSSTAAATTSGHGSDHSSDEQQPKSPREAYERKTTVESLNSGSESE
jgi:hypothetical protein